MDRTYLDDLTEVLTKDDRLINESGKLLKTKISELARQLDEDLIKLLLTDPRLKQFFFKDIEGTLIFDEAKFLNFVHNEAFLADSYTAFKNKVGLATSKDDYLSERSEVVLNWPYRDCVLEGGQDHEDQKRDEVFWNEVLGADQRDVLLAPKVLAGFKQYDKNGAHEVTELSENDSFVFHGNNLLTLYTLKKRYAGKIKCIYIDPPYNPDSPSNTFVYNNRFNHSTWLTFMKNRLEVARDMLTNDGVLIVAIDDNEFTYLGVLLNEVFPRHEIHCITIVHNPRGVQGTNFSYVHEYAFFVIPKDKKSIGDRKIDSKDITFRSLRDHGGESLRTDAKNCFYPIIIKNDEIVDFGDVAEDDDHPGQTVKKGDHYYVYPVDQEGTERKWRYARQSIEGVRHLLRAKKSKTGYEISIGKDFGQYKTVWTGSRYDSNEYGTKLIKRLVPGCRFDFPKSLWNVYDCLYAVVGEDKDAIVMDFFGGSGTTAHAVLELNKDGGNRRFILAEQMHYVESCTVPRIVAALKEDNINTGFVYAYLKNDANAFLRDVEKVTKQAESEALLAKITKSNFLSYRFDPSKFEKEKFARLPLREQKRLLIELVDKNKLYINYHDIDDANYKIDEHTKELNNWMQDRN
jgi:adenine-specific DNA-methyltransferase